MMVPRALPLGDFIRRKTHYLDNQVLVMRDPHNHQSRGFGFITFQRDASAEQVLQNRYHDMMGKRVS